MIDGKDQSRRGLLWLGSAAILARIVDLGATLAVVGLLTREQMGLAALALSTAAIVESLSGIGVGIALVQSKDVSPDEESSLFWLTGGVGLILGIVQVLLGPVLGYLYAEAQLVPLTAASGLKLVLIGLSVVPLQGLSRNLKFREVGAVQTLSSLAEGIIKTGLAFGGAGAWALVIGNVSRGVALLTALWFFAEFRPRLHFAAKETQRFLQFGLHVAGSNVLYQVYKNVDRFLVGKFLGIEPLGLYRVAVDVAMQPTEAINVVMGRVGFPVYARLNHDLAALRAAFVSNTRSLLLMVAPVAAFVYFAAADMLELIGGGKWTAAAPAVHLLVVAGLVRAAAIMFPQVYVAIGRPQLATLDAVVTFVGLTLSFVVGLAVFPELGVLSVCYGWVAVCPLLLAGHLVLSHRVVGLEPLSYVRALGPALGALAVLGAGLSLVRRLTPASDHGWTTVVVIIVATLVIYSAYLRWVLKVRWREIVPKRSPATAPVAPELD